MRIQGNPGYRIYVIWKYFLCKYSTVCEDNVEKIVLFRRDKLFLAAVNNNLASFRVFFKGIRIRPRQSKLEPCCNAAASAVRDTITNGVVQRSKIPYRIWIIDYYTVIIEIRKFNKSIIRIPNLHMK